MAQGAQEYFIGTPEHCVSVPSTPPPPAINTQWVSERKVQSTFQDFFLDPSSRLLSILSLPMKLYAKVSHFLCVKNELGSAACEEDLALEGTQHTA